MTTGINAAFQTITQSHIDTKTKNALTLGMSQDQFNKKDLQFATDFMNSRAKMPGAPADQVQLAKELNTFNASAEHQKDFDIHDAVKRVDTAQAQQAAPAKVEASTPKTDATGAKADASTAKTDAAKSGETATTVTKKLDAAKQPSLNDIADQQVGAKGLKLVDPNSKDGSDVKNLIGAAMPDTKSMSYGDAVKAYQSDQQLNKVDGLVGPETLRALRDDTRVETGAKTGSKATQQFYGHTPKEWPASDAPSSTPAGECKAESPTAAAPAPTEAQAPVKATVESENGDQTRLSIDPEAGKFMNEQGWKLGQDGYLSAPNGPKFDLIGGRGSDQNPISDWAIKLQDGELVGQFREPSTDTTGALNFSRVAQNPQGFAEQGLKADLARLQQWADQPAY